MTIHEYEQVAWALRASDPGEGSSLRGGWMRAVNGIATQFAGHNHCFDSAEFVLACEGKVDHLVKSQGWDASKDHGDDERRSCWGK